MCKGCNDISDLVHDTQNAPDVFISAEVIKTVKNAAFASRKAKLSTGEIATFLLVLGASLLVWENE